MIELASGFHAALCSESHVHSFAECPQIVDELIKATGIRLALDYSHFVCLGYRQGEIDQLAAFAVHVHLRQAKMGAQQTKLWMGPIMKVEVDPSTSFPYLLPLQFQMPKWAPLKSPAQHML